MKVTAGPSPAGCAGLLASLPDRLGDLDRRATTDPARAVAWGDPAVTLVCGAPAPEPQAQSLQLGAADGTRVEFAVGDTGPGYTYTPLAVPVPVVVSIPDDYDSQLLIPLIPLLRPAG